MKQQRYFDSLLNIGVKQETVNAARDAIMEILNVRADQKTIQDALQAFINICETKNNVFNSCIFDGTVKKSSDKNA